MPSPISFYFDFSSPYGYLASELIESLAARHDRRIEWQPILLGAVFKITGQRPLVEAPMKGEYAIMDFTRTAREHKIPFSYPDKFPIGAVAASRASLWLRDHDDVERREQAIPLMHALFRAYYVDGRDISSPATVLDVATDLGVDSEALTAALTDQSVKDKLRIDVEAAIEKGVFGSPTFIVDNEMFWGSDRLEMLDRWLTNGGW